MPSERFFVHKEDGSLVRLKGRLVRFLDEEPPTGSDKSAIRTALEVSPDAEGLVQADVGTDPNQLVLHQHLGDISYQSSDSVAMGKAEIESTTGTATTQALTVTDGSSTKFVVQEDGKVGVGGTPNYALDVSAGSVSLDSDWPLYFGSSNAFIEGGTSGTKLRLNHSAGLNITNAGTTHLAIDSSGRVGIGNSSPTTNASGTADDLVVGNGGDHGITIYSGTGASGRLFFSDGTGAATYRGYIRYDHGSNSMLFGTNSSQRWAINSSGALVSSGLGIDFGSTNSTSGVTVTGSTLDHYEAGTWTPTVGFITAGPTPGASAAYSGRYTRIGRMVYCSIDLDFDNAATSIAVDDRWTMTGLPFSVASELQTYTGAGSFIVYGSVASGVNALGTVGISQTSDTVLFYVTHLDGTLGYDYNVRAIFSYETDA